MTPIRILGIVLIVVGGVLFYFSNYIADQVAQGQGQVESAQGKVDTANSLFSLNPYSKQVGSTLTSPVQKRIDAGNQQIAQYSALIRPLQIGGIASFVVGVLLLIFGGRKRLS